MQKAALCGLLFVWCKSALIRPLGTFPRKREKGCCLACGERSDWVGRRRQNEEPLSRLRERGRGEGAAFPYIPGSPLALTCSPATPERKDA